MIAATKSTDLRSSLVERQAERKQQDLELIRGFIGARAADEPFDGEDLTPLVDVAERRGLDLERLDEFVDVAKVDQFNQPIIDGLERALAELEKKEKSLRGRRIALDRELVEVKNGLRGLASDRMSKIEAAREARQLRLANPLLFSDDAEIALSQKRAITPAEVSRLQHEGPPRLSNVGQAV